MALCRFVELTLWDAFIAVMSTFFVSYFLSEQTCYYSNAGNASMLVLV